jgi:hypothetical protein
VLESLPPEGTCTVKCMTSEPRREEKAVLAELASTRESLVKIEEEWKDLRWNSRKLTLELITEHAISIAKASKLSGHSRVTIKSWLDIHNAMAKMRRDLKG